MHVRGLDTDRPPLDPRGRTEERRDERLLHPARVRRIPAARPPKRARRGHVFKPLNKDGREPVRHEVAVSKVIAKAGEGVKVKETRKIATAHDFRRTFCRRVCNVLPAETARYITRHADSKTLQEYYLDRSPKAVAHLWKAAQQTQEVSTLVNTEGEK